MKANRYYSSLKGFYKTRANIVRQLAFVLFIGMIFFPALLVKAQQIQTGPEGQPIIETNLKLHQLDIFETMGGSASVSFRQGCVAEKICKG